MDGVYGSALISYNVGISACEKGGQWQRALVLLGEMWEEMLEPNVLTYDAGIRAYEKGGQLQRAQPFFGRMWETARRGWG